MSALDAETSTRAHRVIASASTGEKYVELKEFLLKTSLSRWERTERVLAVSELGDRKPSALVNYLFSTLGEYGPEVLLQLVFLRA